MKFTTRLEFVLFLKQRRKNAALTSKFTDISTTDFKN